MQPVSLPRASLICLDLANECLRYGAQAISLRPKTFAVLRCLIEHAQQLVSKTTLLDVVWPETVVSDGVLMVCIRELRQALGDDSRTPRFMATVHRRGYRFIGHVTGEPVSAGLACLWLTPQGNLPAPVRPAIPPPVWEQKPVAVLVIALTFPTPGSLTASYASQNVVSRWQQHIAEQVQKFEGVLLPGVPLLHVVAFGLPLALACKHQEHSNQAYALRLLGEIAAHRASSGVDSAAVHYRQALTLANELGMRPLQAHCHYGLGMLYLKMQQQDQARTALSTAIALYHAMEMTFWLPPAEAALAQMEGR